MAPEHTRDGESRNGAIRGPDGEARPDLRPTRRGVLLGVSLAGLGGALAGCSTSAVPYGANEGGAVPGQAPGGMSTSTAMATSGTMSSSGGATPSSPAPAGSAPDGAGPSSPAPKAAKAAGTVLGAASEIPVGGGKIYKAAKVVVTQPARGQYKAFSAVCTHVGCIMSEVAGGTIDCPCHGGQYKITDGAVVAGPPPRPLPARPVKIVNGQVVLL
jgi:Rieske Fe-S protein